jgi:hypothetical protein
MIFFFIRFSNRNILCISHLSYVLHVPPIKVLDFVTIMFVEVARMGEGRSVHRVLVGKPEGRRPLGRPRRRWEDNIKIDPQEVGVGGGDWMKRGQDRDRWRALVSTVMNFQVP